MEQLTPELFELATTAVYVIFKFALYSIKFYIAVYMFSCCHEVLEDHREGTVNARGRFRNALISSLMLSLTLVGIYGVIISHFGLLVTWFLLKPVIRILELESTIWTTVAMLVMITGWTFCYCTYETLNETVALF